MFYTAKSKLYRGRGLFCKKDLPAGYVIPEKFSSYMNDANFIYPDEFTYEKIRFAIIMHGCLNNNNCYQGEKERVVTTTKNIIAGEELTKNYGLSKWGNFLLLECMYPNFFERRHHQIDVYPDLDQARVWNEIGKAFGEFGYTCRVIINDRTLYSNRPSSHTSSKCHIL